MTVIASPPARAASADPRRKNEPRSRKLRCNVLLCVAVCVLACRHNEKGFAMTGLGKSGLAAVALPAATSNAEPGEPASPRGSRRQQSCGIKSGCTRDAIARATGLGTLPMPLVIVPSWLHPKRQLLMTTARAGVRLPSGAGLHCCYPEQSPANNPKRCFNWFEPADAARSSGEALSILQMVERCSRLSTTASTVGASSLTGLSAGARWRSHARHLSRSVRGRRLIAGLPDYGAAANVKRSARQPCSSPTSAPAQRWGDLVRAASSHRGPWPAIAIWEGMADTTVVTVDANELLKQWQNVPPGGRRA